MITCSFTDVIINGIDKKAGHSISEGKRRFFHHFSSIIIIFKIHNWQNNSFKKPLQSSITDFTY